MNYAPPTQPYSDNIFHKTRGIEDGFLDTMLSKLPQKRRLFAWEEFKKIYVKAHKAGWVEAIEINSSLYDLSPKKVIPQFYAERIANNLSCIWLLEFCSNRENFIPESKQMAAFLERVAIREQWSKNHTIELPELEFSKTLTRALFRVISIDNEKGSITIEITHEMLLVFIDGLKKVIGYFRVSKDGLLTHSDNTVSFLEKTIGENKDSYRIQLPDAELSKISTKATFAVECIENGRSTIDITHEMLSIFIDDAKKASKYYGIDKEGALLNTGDPKKNHLNTVKNEKSTALGEVICKHQSKRTKHGLFLNRGFVDIKHRYHRVEGDSDYPGTLQFVPTVLEYQKWDRLHIRDYHIGGKKVDYFKKEPKAKTTSRVTIRIPRKRRTKK